MISKSYAEAHSHPHITDGTVSEYLCAHENPTNDPFVCGNIRIRNSQTFRFAQSILKKKISSNYTLLKSAILEMNYFSSYCLLLDYYFSDGLLDSFIKKYPLYSENMVKQNRGLFFCDLDGNTFFHYDCIFNDREELYNMFIKKCVKAFNINKNESITLKSCKNCAEVSIYDASKMNK